MFETDTIGCTLLLAKAATSDYMHLSDLKDQSGLVGSVLALIDNDFQHLRDLLKKHSDGLTDVLVCGGSPCQGFSRASPGAKGLDDSRSSLVFVFHAIASFARSILPSNTSVAVIVENVVFKEPSIR
eukprot:6949200-Heterocapsa_arctica.AAC.1